MLRTLRRLACESRGRSACLMQLREIHTTSPRSEDRSQSSDGSPKKVDSVPASFKTEFREFRDESSPVVYDTLEEQQMEEQQMEEQRMEEQQMEGQGGVMEEEDPFAGYNVKRGVRGVFDIEELADIIRREKGKDICVLRMPCDQYHMEHMMLVTVRSKLHLWALQEFIRKLYKRKKHHTDPIPFTDKKQAGEGLKGNITWISLNLGNITLHLMLQDTREYYDIESLWAVGPEFDELMQVKEEKYANLLDELMSLDDFKPATKINL